MVDLETAARSFKDALDAPGAVESATQLRTLLASIKADLQRLLRRIHPPGPPTVPRAPRVVVAHAVLSSAMPTCEPSKRLDSLPPTDIIYWWFLHFLFLFFNFSGGLNDIGGGSRLFLEPQQIGEIALLPAIAVNFLFAEFSTHKPLVIHNKVRQLLSFCITKS